MLVAKETKKYLRTDHLLFTSDGERSYAIRVRDLPEEERPLEKLLKQGAISLSLAELFSIVLVAGTKKEEVGALTRRIIKEYGEKNILGEKDPKKLSESLE